MADREWAKNRDDRLAAGAVKLDTGNVTLMRSGVVKISTRLTDRCI